MWLQHRKGSPYLYVRYGYGNNWRWRSLGHDDWTQGEKDAEEIMRSLRDSVGEGRGEVTISMLFGRYRREKTPTKGAVRQTEDLRRLEMWEHFFLRVAGINTPEQIDHSHLNRFVTLRRTGELRVPRRKLKKGVRNRIIEQDLQFLTAVMNWGLAVNRRGTTKKLLAADPTKGFERPKEENPTRKVGTYDHFLAVLEKADEADSQGLLKYYAVFEEGLGWRSSVVCEVWASDFDFTRSTEHPHGRIRKRERVGSDRKESREWWVPMTTQVREAAEKAIAHRGIVGDVYLFPAKKSEGPWTKDHALKLWYRAQRLAGIDDVVGIHAFRRKWATERKHHPRKDVAHAGGWKSERTLEIYETADPETTLAVMEEPTKLRRVSVRNRSTKP